MSGASGTKACGRFREDLSAFADHTLSDRRWKQVGYHVAGCEACRRELDDIKRVCTTLSGACAGRAGAPSMLAARLADIAGEDPDAPLYMATGTVGGLPSGRRERRRRIHQGSVAAMTALASFFILALLLAPEPPVVSDPVNQAREDYSLATTAISVNEAIGAVLLAHERGAQLSAPVHRRARATLVNEPFRLTPEVAAQRLAAGKSSSLTYSGVQRVWVSNGEGAFHSSDVRIDKVAGEGARLDVLDSSGDRFSAWFVPSSSCCELVGPSDWTFFEYQGMDQVAGHWATVLEARDADDRKVARWWLDSVSGLLLWSERYDTSGAPTLVSGFLELRSGEATLRHEGAELILLTTTDPSGTALPEHWCSGFDHCRDTLAGMPLVAYSSSEAGGRTTMRLVYSDGIRAISTCWTEGVLDKGHASSVVGDVQGLPEVAVWQAGDGVVSVATNGGLAVLRAAAEELPAERAHETTLIDRFRRGLSRLGGIN